MFKSVLSSLKGIPSVEARFAPVREFSRRLAGPSAWASKAPETEHYQPQDGAADEGSTFAEMVPRRRKPMAGEPEDARITGGTRSLMRRLTGLNLTRELPVRRPAAMSKMLPPSARVA